MENKHNRKNKLNGMESIIIRPSILGKKRSMALTSNLKLVEWKIFITSLVLTEQRPQPL